jgi:hypothetical protein
VPHITEVTIYFTCKKPKTKCSLLIEICINSKGQKKMKEIKALFFDQDGTIIDTEKDGHRVAFNKAFKEFGFDIEWDVETYYKLLEVAGGKERMRHYLHTEGFGNGLRLRPRGTLSTDCWEISRHLHHPPSLNFYCMYSPVRRSDYRVISKST